MRAARTIAPVLALSLISAGIAYAWTTPTSTPSTQTWWTPASTVHSVNDAATADPLPSPTEAISDDDPRWDCHTMGNRICGPVATPDDRPEWLSEATADFISGVDTPRTQALYEAQVFVEGMGGTWVAVTQELGDALAEGETPEGYEASNYPWESCAVAYADTMVVACPDGIVVTS